MQILNIPVTPQELAAQIQAGENRIKDLEAAAKDIDELLGRLQAFLSAMHGQEKLEPEKSAELLELLTRIAYTQHLAIRNTLAAQLKELREAVANLRGALLQDPKHNKRQ